MTLKESIAYAAKNPNTEFALELRKRIESGQYNDLAKQEGLDFSQYTKQDAGTTGVAGFGVGIAKEVGQRIASPQQNVGKVVEAATESAIGIQPAEAHLS